MKPKRPSDDCTNRGGASPSHPDIRNDRPGRIPESLINAAIDGELNEDMQREIADALQYDPDRKQELIDTADAINALQMPISTPDFAHEVLARADRHHRFIPAAWRKHVRAGRLGIAAMVLLSLAGVAGLQTVYPRFTTLASHPTPVKDIESAVCQDANEFVSIVKEEARTLKASVAPFDMGSGDFFFGVPGRTNHRVEISASDLRTSSMPDDQLSGHLGLARRFPSRAGSAGGFFDHSDAVFVATSSPMRFVAVGFNPGYRSHGSGASGPVGISVAYTPVSVSARASQLKREISEIDISDLP